MMFEESGDRRDKEEGQGRSSHNAMPQGESYYSSEHDSMLRIDRRSMRRVQTYWIAGDNLESRFADHVQVAQVDEHYHLTFGQSRIPVSREANEPASVAEVLPVARVILPEDVIKRLAVTLRDRIQV
jgi:hypothetical protein